ncbi:Tfp pilus assembly protein FimT/FimU [Acinetobacter sp. c2-A9]|uniref:pilus assembly FimT family protein n=1 Tax=Acinetobacter sp. c2-A9 TaxID=3342802 RepID=UPI0035BB07D2
MKRHQKGFTLIELLITIVLLGILASMAMPSFSKTIRQNQVNQEVQGVTESLTKARVAALLKKQSVFVEPCSSDSCTPSPATKQVVYYKTTNFVEWDSQKKPNVEFNYMGFVTGATSDKCFLLKHKSDKTVARAILLSPNGSISVPRNKTSCS